MGKLKIMMFLLIATFLVASSCQAAREAEGFTYQEHRRGMRKH